MPVPADPTVSFSVSFAVGSQNDPPGKEGLAHLTGSLIAEGGTHRHSYEEILERLYPLAADYDVCVDREMTTVTGRAHKETVPAFVELFTAAYLEPAFGPEDFERVRGDVLNYLRNTLRYSSDEELGRAALEEAVFAGTPYAHPPEGTVAGLEAITLDDVRRFYAAHYHGGNALVALAGGFDDALAERMRATVERLPAAAGEAAAAGTHAAPRIVPRPIRGREAVLVDKPGADASISCGFPIDVHRGERDFYALWIANSWLGEHRNQASHLFQVIREARGLNYGDYSYIEAFPGAGELSMPPVNVPRRHPIFEIWIRTLPNDQALFALRAALRELAALVDRGLSEAQFDLTRRFLRKYSLHFAETTEERLGYAVDDRFFRVDPPGHLERFRAMMDELTLDEVNAAVAKHLQYERLKIAIVTGEPDALREALQSGRPSPIRYESQKPADLLAEDREIASWPLRLDADAIEVVPAASMFERARGPLP